MDLGKLLSSPTEHLSASCTVQCKIVPVCPEASTLLSSVRPQFPHGTLWPCLKFNASHKLLFHLA